MPEPTSSTVGVLKHVSDRANERVAFSFHAGPKPAHITNKHKGVLSLGGGRPHEGFFPVHSISFSVQKKPFSEGELDQKVIKSEPTDDVLDIREGFQYTETKGTKPVLAFAHKLTEQINPPGFEDYDITLTNGTGDSLHKVFNLLINKGDVVLVEDYTYVPVLNNFVNYGGIPVAVETNFAKGGLDVDKLEILLENWESVHPGKNKPKVLYTIPTGQNPTGLSISLEDRVKLVKLASRFDFIIVEDDPYGYIQLRSTLEELEDITNKDYVEALSKPLISLDTEGRVLRLESFSKVLSPGSRTGFIVGHSALIKHIVHHAQISTRASSGISQTVINAVLRAFEKSYDGPENGFDTMINGWLHWLVQLSKTYTERKLTLLKTIEDGQAYKKGYVKYYEPNAGMFTIIELNLPESEDYQDSIEHFRYKTIEHGLAVVLGKNLGIGEAAKTKAKFIRLTIASATDLEELKEAGKRLDEAIVDFFES